MGGTVVGVVCGVVELVNCGVLKCYGYVMKMNEDDIVKRAYKVG